VRYFFSTGELSGEAAAIALAQAIREIDSDAQFEGIGAEAMRAAGFRLWRNHSGWASMGPLAAIPRIPKLLNAMLRTAAHIIASKPNLVVLVDFGVFNLRLASTLRRFGYEGPILDLFPPGTWLDNEEKARRVSALTVPVTAFKHQYEFYQSIGCRIVYFGHPLASQFPKPAQRPAPPRDGGVIAMMPGSRSGELRRHLPVLAAAYRVLQERRPGLRGVFAAADARGAAQIARALEREALTNVSIVRGVAAALTDADGAWAASGTAVLETALAGVPVVALYVIPPILIWYGRRMIQHRFITLPNLVLGREVVPELLQEQATPERLADSLDTLMTDPSKQYAASAELRQALGPADALVRCGRFAVDLAQVGRDSGSRDEG
jgi:lipid-A-disaccharide synthase